MGEAAKISLKAIGKQDTHLLSDDPEESFFNYTSNRAHSDFRKYHRSRNVIKPGNADVTWPFNKTIKVEFNPRNMGDLLSNMYLSVTMPGLSDESVDRVASKKYIETNFTHPPPTTSDPSFIYVAPLSSETSRWVTPEIISVPPIYQHNGYAASMQLSGDGERMVVGKPEDSTLFVYKYVNTEWFIEDTIEGIVDPSNGKFIGRYVSIDETGETIVTSTWYTLPPSDLIRFSIISYKRSGGTWTQADEYFFSTDYATWDSGSNDFIYNGSLGVPTNVKLSSDGTKLVVAFNGTLSGTSGSSFPATPPNERIQLFTLDSNGNFSADYKFPTGYIFPHDLDISDDGNTVVYTVLGEFDGAVRNYKYDGANWNYSSITTGNYAATNSDGTKMVISDASTAYFYEYIGSSWTLTHTFSLSSPTKLAVDINDVGDTVIIGGVTTYILKYVDSSWTILKELQPTDSYNGYHGYGNLVSVDSSGEWHTVAEHPFYVYTPDGRGGFDLSYTGTYEGIDVARVQSMTTNYADQLGRHLLKSVTMYVDDIEVEKIYDDWGIIYDELYLEISEKVANGFLVNRNLGFDDAPLSGNVPVARYSSDLVIPIHFFFSRKFASDEYSSNKPNRPYFPVCSIYKQKIEFEFEFHKQEFFTDSTDVLTLPQFNVITEEITVNPEERIFLTNQRQTFITDLVRRHPVIVSDLNSDIIRNNLVPNIPVKCIHWFLRNTEFENESNAIGLIPWEENGGLLYQNRFNFSSTRDFQGENTFFHPLMTEASFFVNGTKLPNVTKTNHSYFKYLIPFQKRLARPIRNIYTYSFSMNPINVEPSGNLDFSQIQSDKTNIEVKLDTYEIDLSTETFSLNMYYTGYQTFIFSNGFMSIAY